MAPTNQYYMYPSYPQYRYEPPQPQPNLSLKGRPVGSIEEARASMIDFDGSTFYFPDVARGCIYAKRINLDGTSTLDTYQRVETPSSQTIEGYVTSETFEKTIQELVNQINSLKGVQHNVQPRDDKPNEQFSF